MPRHGDADGEKLALATTVPVALLVTLGDAATLAVTDDVGVADAAGDDVADVVRLRKERRALARTQEARAARACAGAAAATPARPPARTVTSMAHRPRAPRPGKSRRFASCARAGSREEKCGGRRARSAFWRAPLLSKDGSHVAERAAGSAHAAPASLALLSHLVLVRQAGCECRSRAPTR